MDSNVLGNPHNYDKIMADALTDFTNRTDKLINGALDASVGKPEVLALCGIGYALLAQCVLLERIADRLDEGGIGVEVTQA